MADSAAAIAFLVREIARIDVAPNDDFTAGTVRDGIGHAERKLTRLASARRNGVEYLKAPGKLPGIAGKQNLLAIRLPSCDATERALEGEAFGDAALRGHDIDLARAFFTSNKS